MDRVGRGEAAGGDQGLAAAAAAVADEVHALPDVLAELHEVELLRPVEEVEPLGDVHLPCVAVADEGGGGRVERHADVPRRVAGAPHVLHLVTAVAEGNPPVRRGPDHLAGALEVEDVEGVLLGEDRLLHEGAAELGLPGGEERRTKSSSTFRYW